MRTLLLATLLFAAGCRTGNLGKCSSDSDCPSGATCDPAENVCAVRSGDCFPTCAAGLSCQSAACVDVTAPTISAITVTTPPDFPPAIYKGEDGGTLSIGAQIVDVSGVQNVCLQVSGETGCPHAGSSLDGGFWTFTMPRAPTAGTLDGTPVSFTIAADDAPPGRTPNHGTATGVVRFDNVGPSIQIPADPQPYARVLADGGADLLRFDVVISDATGICETGPCRPKLTVGGGTPSPSVAQDGGAFTFELDATKATTGTEGPLSFTVTAQDALGHQATAVGTRFVDDKAPAVTLKVFRDGDTEPASGVAFPTAAPNTGYDGNTFLYSDVVHVKGTIQDQGGLGAASWRIDGIAVDGGVSTGTSNPLCDGGTSCSFDVQVALNALRNGEFHTRDQRAISANLHATNGDTSIPVGDLRVVVTAADRAQTASGSALGNVTPQSTAVRATRFLWLANLPAGAIVHGLALHPNGDLIATTENPGTTAADEVFALPTQARPLADGRFPFDWRFGADAGFTPAGFGDIVDMPTVGGGDATTAQVYVATTDGGVFALHSDGTLAWRAAGLQELWTAPAVVSAQAGDTIVIPSVAPGAAGASVFTVSAGATGTAVVLDAGTVDDDFNSAPLVLDGGTYFGTLKTLYRLDLRDGGLNGFADAGGEIWSPVTDGTFVYTATRTTIARGTLTTFDPSPTAQHAVSVDGGVVQDMIVDMNGNIIASDRNSHVLSIDPSDGDLVSLGDLIVLDSQDGKIPLQGSDGHLYVPRGGGVFFAFTHDHATSWTFGSNVPLFRAAAMDCAGRVYVASDETIYALITDDHGLADAPWPTYRRDSRATGNFDAPKYGIRLPGPDGGVCDN